MSAPVLRPLGVGEILDAGLKVYRANARTLMAMTAIVIVPVQVLSGFALLSIVSTVDEVPRSFQFGARPAVGDLHAALGADFVVGLLNWIAGLLVTAICVKTVSDSYMGQASGFGISLRFVRERVFSLLWMEVVLLCVLVAAFAALVIPGIWLAVSSIVAAPVLIVEGRSGWKAIRRSIDLVRGNWGRTFGLLFGLTVMISIVSGAIAGLLDALGAFSGSGTVAVAVLGTTFSSAIAAILTRPFQAAVVTILYYDLRVRSEGYDVQLLAEQLGIEPADMPAGEAWGTGAPPRPSWGQPPGSAPPFWPPPPGWSPPSGAASPPAVPGGANTGMGAVGAPDGPPFWPPPPGWSPPSSAASPPAVPGGANTGMGAVGAPDGPPFWPPPPGWQPPTAGTHEPGE